MANDNNKYVVYVKPKLDWIRENAPFMTEGQIAKSLGVSGNTFTKYKKSYPELEEALKTGQQNLVPQLKSKLLKKAMGYEYIETKTTERADGEGKVYSVETITKNIHVGPDLGSICALLKNYDKTWHNDDSIVLELRRKEIELRERELKLKEKAHFVNDDDNNTGVIVIPEIKHDADGTPIIEDGDLNG